ncbi:glycine cleavage system protein T [candidate division TA06 bacterium SM1_40]|uniref:Aminomethyltransferase n=1 Tax=candidate division TA06 bacterium SM1_40 TaxID=1703773 RepID=A0A0S8JPS5_UNCT6|nr:MAG: glycine cleavage system protein T [candidate division TA06 bacterium SM1_40]
MEEKSPRRTPFFEKHKALGARIVEFAGFEMPIQFTSIIEEHRAVRSNVGMFDVSHMGEVTIRGPDALEFVNYVTINDAAQLAVGQAQYSALCYEDGGLVDDLVVYRLVDHFLFVVNAANIEKDYDWIVSNRSGDVEIENSSYETGQLAVQGPNAELVMQRVTNLKLSEIQFYWSAQGKVGGVEALVSRTGYTGEDGFEIYMAAENGPQVWDTIVEAGKEFSLKPVGLGARDTLRLEMKYNLYGNDMDETTTPLEAGLSWITKLEKEEFIGQEALKKQKEEGVKRRLIAFEMMGNEIPRPGFDILVNGEKVGHVTSGTFSPSLEKGIGLGYVARPHTKSGTELTIVVRGEPASAAIVKPPFYKHGTHH